MSAAWSASPGFRSRGFEGRVENLRDFLYFAGAYAGGADAQAPVGAVYDRANGLQIEIPAALGNIVGVTDAVAELRPATAYFTNSCHKTKIVAASAVFPQLAHALEV